MPKYHFRIPEKHRALIENWARRQNVPFERVQQIFEEAGGIQHRCPRLRDGSFDPIPMCGECNLAGPCFCQCHKE